MKVKELRIGYAETNSFGDFGNVRPSVELVINLDDQDNYDEVFLEMMREAEHLVRWEIDRTRVRNRKRPIYYEGVKYRVMYSRTRGCVVVFPDDAEYPRDFFDTMKIPRGISFDDALRFAAELAQENNYTLIECRDGDLDRLPEPTKERTVIHADSDPTIDMDEYERGIPSYAQRDSVVDVSGFIEENTGGSHDLSD